jgi:hypothetical protein
MEGAKQQGVVFVGDVGVVSCAIADNTQLCGGRTVTSQLGDDPRKMLFAIWVPQPNGKGFRLTPFSMVRGKHSPASGLKFHLQTGKLVALGADFQAMAAIFHWLHLSRTASVDGKWHGLRSKIGSLHMNPEEIDKATFGNGIRMAQEKTWPDLHLGRKKRPREEGGCGSPMHKRYRPVGKLHPLAVEYCEFRMCVACLRHAVLKTQPDVQANQTAVLTRASTGKEILSRCTKESRPFVRTLFNYTLDKFVASVDKLHFADPSHLTLHAVAIVCYWMYFPHIYSDRVASYAICQAEFLKGARRAALCKTTPCSSALKTAAVYVQDNVYALSSFGRAACSCLKGVDDTGNQLKQWFVPWIHFTPDMRTIHHRHELLVKEKWAYTRSFVQVLSAIASGMLVLSVHLTPCATLPVTEKLRVSVRAWQVLCSGKAKETAYRTHPDEWTDGEFVNYEWLANLLWKNRMACHDHGLDPVPINVNLFGSLTRAILGRTDTFGPTSVKSGATFIELVGLGLQSFSAVNVTESCYSDTLLYAGVPNATAIADSMRTERVMINKGGGIQRICERIHKNLEVVQGEDPPDLVWSENPITPAMYDEMQGFIWPNETPDGGIGLDAETLMAAKGVAGK